MALINPINAGQGLDPGAAPSTARDNAVAHGLAGLGSVIGQAADVQQRLKEMNGKRERFAAEEQWQRTQRELDALHAEALKNLMPGAANFTANLGEAMGRSYSGFLEAVPRELQPYYAERIDADRDVRLGRAAADEVARRGDWYRASIGVGVNAAGEAIAADPSRHGEGRLAVHTLIDEADLPAAQRDALRRDADAALGRAWIAGMLRTDPARAVEALGVGDSPMAAPEVAMLSPSERLGLYEEARVAIERQRAATAAAEKKQERRLVGELSDGIRLGSTTTAGILAAPVADEIRVGLLQDLAEQRGREKRADDILSAWRSDLAAPVAPFDRNRRAEVNDAYERLATTAPNEATELTIDFVRTFDVVPDRVVEETRQGLASDELLTVAAAMERAAQLAALAPMGLRDAPRGKALIDAATAFEHFVVDRAMTPTAAAAALVRLRDEDPPDAEVLRTRWLKDAAAFTPADVETALGLNAEAEDHGAEGARSG